jgi:transcriptional regulator with XRE-family HTH domain
VAKLDKKHLKDRLQIAMDVRGLRAVDLVDRTGIPKVTISYYMSGKTVPRADKLYLLAQALNVSEAWLLGYDVEMARTDDQKKNDQLAQLVVRMRNDDEFFNAVSALADLDESQFQSIAQLLRTLNK